MKLVELTQGYSAIVDDRDYDRVSEFKWLAQVRPGGKGVYAKTSLPRTYGGHRPCLYMHRLIMRIYNRKIKVDHKDNDGLNNRRCNIRVATTSQNGGNCRKQKHTTSRFKGVHWRKDCKRWSVAVVKNRRRYHIGHFKSEVAAARAYDEAARLMFGEFALVNF
jgi:hypothetical protein